MKNNKLLSIVLLFIPLQLSAAEWLFDANAHPSFKYDDNELMNDDERGDFSMSITPTVLISRRLENVQFMLSFGYQVQRYDRLKQLDRQDPFAKFNTSWNKERSSYGMSMEYSERENRSFADEDTGDFSNTETVTTRTISPSYSYRLSELDTLSTSVSYRETSRTDSTDTETTNLSVGWVRQFSERLSGGLSGVYSNTDSEAITSKTESDSYSLSVTSTYKYSELWDITGSIGWRYLDTKLKPVIGVKSNSNSSGETYTVSAVRKAELSTLTLSSSLALTPTTSGGVNEQNRYSISYKRNLSEKLSATLTASYREFRAPGNDNDKTTYSDISPSLNWNTSEKMTIRFSYQYRMNENESSNTTESNAVFATVNYDWDGIRFSR